jgi:protein SCO1/2
MKTRPALILAALAAAALVRAEDACCAAQKTAAAPAATAKPSCCAEDKPAAPAVSLSNLPLTARSLYQLEATWTDDAGAAFSLASLRGRPVVLAMFFASCEYACPLTVGDMKRLGELLPAETRAQTRFVLVSFDTARDTPAALQAYRQRLQLDSAWTLLRGDAANVQELAMLLGVKFKQDARGQFSHSNLITVLNPEGEITHQRAGLMGDVSEAAKAVALAAAK